MPLDFRQTIPNLPEGFPSACTVGLLRMYCAITAKAFGIDRPIASVRGLCAQEAVCIGLKCHRVLRIEVLNLQIWGKDGSRAALDRGDNGGGGGA